MLSTHTEHISQTHSQNAGVSPEIWQLSVYNCIYTIFSKACTHILLLYEPKNNLDLKMSSVQRGKDDLE